LTTEIAVLQFSVVDVRQQHLGKWLNVSYLVEYRKAKAQLFRAGLSKSFTG
jgi:hypothetical protein